ncbi:MAG TPA: diguanylate cyclase [Spirochaetota bacterium]|nr:diguanylate cyclase [Spirochaetota bacterium]HPJ34522.1 diguanylate cyclase [Spirochaetota bacterium]
MSEFRDYTLAELERADLEKMVFDLQNLIEIALSLSSNLEFDSLVESLLYICIGQMLVDKVALFLHVNFENDDLSSFMSRGYIIPPENKISEKSALLIHLKNNWKIINAEQARELMADDPYTSELYKLLVPEIVIPLRSKNTLNGLIFMSKKIMDTPYTEQEFIFLDKLAKFASIAVENSRLYRMATLDRMTGLFIHHYFQERLAEEIKRAERTENPLTLLMADLDHFKEVNDRYGHPQGDIILKGTANIIHQNIRSFDIPSRYGGEEFAIILADTDIEAAEHIAARLRKRVEEATYLIDNDEVRITISIGIAQFDSHKDMTSKDLIKRADTALYSAKSQGRNRVIRSE